MKALTRLSYADGASLRGWTAAGNAPRRNAQRHSSVGGRSTSVSWSDQSIAVICPPIGERNSEL